MGGLAATNAGSYTRRPLRLHERRQRHPNPLDEVARQSEVATLVSLTCLVTAPIRCGNAKWFGRSGRRVQPCGAILVRAQNQVDARAARNCNRTTRWRSPESYKRFFFFNSFATIFTTSSITFVAELGLKESLVPVQINSLLDVSPPAEYKFVSMRTVVSFCKYPGV
jgi:hypothetical protein